MSLLRSTLYVILTSLVLAEIALRVLSLFPGDTAVFINDPQVGVRLRPNIRMDHTQSTRLDPTLTLLRHTVATNSRGFNDIERSDVRPAGMTRLAMIGDSFVFGHVERDKNFVSLLQRRAAQEAPALEIINMGVIGAGPRTYLGLLDKDGADMHADTVGVMLFLGNDIMDTDPDMKQMVWLGTTRRVLRSPFLIGWSPDYFYLYRMGRSVWRVLGQQARPMFENGTFTVENYLAIERDTLNYFAPGNRQAQRNYTETTRVIDAIVAAARARHMRLFFVLAPDEVQVDDALRADVMRQYGLKPPDFDMQLPNRLLSRAIARHGIPVLDLLPDFSQRADRERLYIVRNTHWNEAGNALAAERIWQFLTTNMQRSAAASH